MSLVSSCSVVDEFKTLFFTLVCFFPLKKSSPRSGRTRPAPMCTTRSGGRSNFGSASRASSVVDSTEMKISTLKTFETKKNFRHSQKVLVFLSKIEMGILKKIDVVLHCLKKTMTSQSYFQRCQPPWFSPSLFRWLFEKPPILSSRNGTLEADFWRFSTDGAGPQRCSSQSRRKSHRGPQW